MMSQRRAQGLIDKRAALRGAAPSLVGVRKNANAPLLNTGNVTSHGGVIQRGGVRQDNHAFRKLAGKPSTETGYATSHGGKAIGELRAADHAGRVAAAGGAKVKVRKAIGGRTESLPVQVNGKRVAGRDVAGSTLGAARIRGQHLVAKGEFERRYSTGDVQRIAEYQTSHGGRVAINKGTGGGIVSKEPGAGHKGGEVVNTSHGGQKVMGGGGLAIGRPRAEIHGLAHPPQQPPQPAGQPLPGHGQRRQATGGNQNMQRTSHGGFVAKKEEAAGVPGAVAHAAAHGGTARAAKAAAAAAAAAAPGAQRASHAADQVLPHDQMLKHIQVIDGPGVGKLAGPLTVTKNLGGGHVSEAHKGEIALPGGKKQE